MNGELGSRGAKGVASSMGFSAAGGAGLAGLRSYWGSLMLVMLVTVGGWMANDSLIQGNQLCLPRPRCSPAPSFPFCLCNLSILFKR